MQLKLSKRIVLLGIYFIVINFTCYGGESIEQWRERVKTIIDNTNKSDSIKVIEISDLSYLYFYYYRTFDESNLDEYFDLVLPLCENPLNNDTKAYIYSLGIIIAKRDNKIELAEKCIHYTEKSNNPKIRSNSWERLGRMYIDNSSGLNYFFKAMDEIKELNDYARESDLYGYIALYYSIQNDTKNLLKYANQALNSAIKSDNPRQIMNSWDLLGEAYYLTGDMNNPDEAIQAYTEARNIYLQEIKPMTTDTEISYKDGIHYMVLLVNLGSMYYYKGELPQAIELINEALAYSVQNNFIETEAYCHKELGRIYLELNDFPKAEKHYLKTEELLSGKYVNTKESEYIDYEIKFALANLYKLWGIYDKSASYYQTGFPSYQAMHDEEQLHENQKLAALYETKKKEEELSRMKSVLLYQDIQRYAYLGIVIAIIIALLIISNLFRLKINYARQNERQLQDELDLLNLKKRKIFLDSRLKLIETEDLRKKISQGNKLIENRNKTLESLKSFFEKNTKFNRFKNQIESILLEQNRIEDNIEEFKSGVNKVPVDFYVRLQKVAENKLTSLDLKYCRLIYLDTPTKEIANLLFVEPKSVQVNKYRLKQKLNLSRDDDLTEFIRNI